MLEAKQDMIAFMAQSMLSADIQREIRGYESEEAKALALIREKDEQLRLCRTPRAVLACYAELTDRLALLVNAARKKARLELNALAAEHKFLLSDLSKLQALTDAEKNLATITVQKNNTVEYIANTVSDLKQILTRDGFAALTGEVDIITEKGRIAAQLQEVHPLAMADLYGVTQNFASLDAAQLAGLFSCFYPVAVSDDLRAHLCSNTALREVLVYMQERLDHYLKAEQDAYLLTGANYEIAYDLIPYVIQWCKSPDELTCKIIIQTVKDHVGIFVGEFVKALLKINAIALEFERICELTQNLALLEKLREIPHLTLKYIATSQSLYL